MPTSQDIDWIQQVKNRPFIDPREYPYLAKFDDTTDDTNSLIDAINDASTQGKALVLPNGIAKITSQISLDSNLYMVGTPGLTILKGYGTGRIFTGTNLSNITLKDFELLGNNTSGTFFESLTLGSSENIVLDNLIIKDFIFGHGFSMANIKRLVVRNCYINNNGTDPGAAAAVSGFYVQYGEDWLFENNVLINNGRADDYSHAMYIKGYGFGATFDPIFLTSYGPKRVIIVNNRVKDHNSGPAINVYQGTGAADWTMAGVIAAGGSDIMIINNLLDRNLGGISVVGMDRVGVKNNKIINTGSLTTVSTLKNAMHIRYCNNAQLKGNEIDTVIGDGDGIIGDPPSDGSDGYSITENKVSRARIGINFGFHDGNAAANINDNLCSYNNWDGILVQGYTTIVENVNVNNNICYANGQGAATKVGIKIKDTNRVSLNNNLCFDTQTPPTQYAGVLLDGTNTNLGILGQRSFGNTVVDAIPTVDRYCRGLDLGSTEKIQVPGVQIGSLAIAGPFGPWLTYNVINDGGTLKAIANGVACALGIVEGRLVFAYSQSANAGDALTWTEGLLMNPNGIISFIKLGSAAYTWQPGYQIGGETNMGVYGIVHTFNAIYNSGWKSIAAGRATALGNTDGRLIYTVSQSAAGAGEVLTFTDMFKIMESGVVYHKLTGIPQYANNAAALAGGLVAGNLYRTGADPDTVCIVH